MLKLLEKAMKLQLDNFLSPKKIIAEFQHRLTSHRGTATQMHRVNKVLCNNLSNQPQWYRSTLLVNLLSDFGQQGRTSFDKATTKLSGPFAQKKWIWRNT